MGGRVLILEVSMSLQWSNSSKSWTSTTRLGRQNSQITRRSSGGSFGKRVKVWVCGIMEFRFLFRSLLFSFRFRFFNLKRSSCCRTVRWEFAMIASWWICVGCLTVHRDYSRSRTCCVRRRVFQQELATLGVALDRTQPSPIFVVREWWNIELGLVQSRRHKLRTIFCRVDDDIDVCRVAFVGKVGLKSIFQRLNVLIPARRDYPI
jgi:hypothetical protein